MKVSNIYELPKFGCGTGIHRVRWLLAVLGIDKDWLQKSSLAITGSNGKGSTAAFVDSLARAHGLKVGLFTSPHFFEKRERFRVDGNRISLSAYEQLEQEILSRIKSYEEENPTDYFGSFEALFALAVAWFQEMHCELCVLEAGIGGRFDPVQVAHASLAAVTSLDLEHTEVLGETLQAICDDKTDVCGKGGTVFYGENCLSLENDIRLHCEERGISPYFLGRDCTTSIQRERSDGTDFILHLANGDSLRLTIPLIGPHQVNNAALALLLFRGWYSRNKSRELDSQKILQGFASTVWPGRLEKLLSDPLIVIDAGHTPDGVQQALNGLKRAYPKRSWVLVTGVSQNKKVPEILEILVPEFDIILCTEAEKNGYPAQDLLEIAKSISPRKAYQCFNSLDEALPSAFEIARAHDLGIYVAGGMFLASEFSSLLRVQAPVLLPSRMQRERENL